MKRVAKRNLSISFTLLTFIFSAFMLGAPNALAQGLLVSGTTSTTSALPVSYSSTAQPSDYQMCKDQNLNDNLLPHLSTLAANAKCNPNADVRTFLEDGICYMECADTATGVGNLYKVFKSGSDRRKIACAYCGGAVPRKQAKTTYKHDSTGKAVGILKFEEGSDDCTFNSYG